PFIIHYGENLAGFRTISSKIVCLNKIMIGVLVFLITYSTRINVFITITYAQIEVSKDMMLTQRKDKLYS
ncbi:MAG TPA: hypothetical protein VH481_11230, partial [Nitrososphaeraceae archaeon]